MSDTSRIQGTTGPLPRALLPFTIPLSWAYGAVVAGRNRLYDRGWNMRAASVPVISVGNLSVGGAGKTPLVRFLADLLVEHGHRPVVALRGYGAARGTESDEAIELREMLAGVRVVADPDRRRAVARAVAADPLIDCALLDDGFQHRRLRRDLDLVLIDASRETLGAKLLPAGFLRERPGSLRRADGVIVTRASEVDRALAAAIERAHGRPPLAWTRHVWSRLTLYGAEGARELPAEWMRARRIIALLGVGNPTAVLDQARSAGASIVAALVERDHHRFTRDDVRRAFEGRADAEALFVTGKDWVKLRGLIDWSDAPLPAVVPEVAIEVHSGLAELTECVLAAVGRSGESGPGRRT